MPTYFRRQVRKVKGWYFTNSLLLVLKGRAVLVLDPPTTEGEEPPSARLPAAKATLSHLPKFTSLNQMESLPGSILMGPLLVPASAESPSSLGAK